MRILKILLIYAIIFMGQRALAQVYDLNKYMPDSIKNITSAEAIKPYLTNSHIDIRIYGVIRLGQIGKEEDIISLRDAYNNEPVRTGRIIDITHGVKYYALESIGKIGGALAESTLISIGNQLWGSTCTDSQLILISLCEFLGKFNSQASYQLLINLYQNHGFPWNNRVYALANAYSIELLKAVYSNEKDSIDYLLSMAPKSGPYGMENRENCIIMTAIRNILLRENSCNANSIKYLLQKTTDNSINSNLQLELGTIVNQMQRKYERLQNQN